MSDPAKSHQANSPELDDQRLLRYSRQILLPEIGVEGQQRLLESSVLLIGLGGLGSPAAIYLAACGIGRLLIADDDKIELSNLQRQILFDSGQLQNRKVSSAERRLKAINPDVEVAPIAARVNEANLPAWVRQADVVVDASDNFSTRYAINRACRKEGKPLISGAVIRMEGQLSVFMPDGSPCYACLYPQETFLDESCVNNGVLGPVAGVIGSAQAIEAVKILLGLGRPLSSRLLLFDALTMEWRELSIPRNTDCPVRSK